MGNFGNNREDGNVAVSGQPIAIQFSGVKKRYRLGQVGSKTLQEDLQSWWAKRRGKEDPNTRIGTDQRLIGQTFMALNGVDLTIYQGEAVGIIGSNGAGKSTLLKLLSQVTAPTQGSIDIWGRVASLLEIGTGFNGELTGRENVFMNGAILGMTRREIEEVLDDIIEFSEVGEFIDTPVKRYSSGMYIRLAFAVAAHLKSEILVCDEVLAVGDMAFQNKCLARMREAAIREGRTVLYVSHNMNTIRTLCDRCIVIDAGRVIFDGAVDEAVAIYMNNALSENEVDINLAEKSRGESVDRSGVHMERLELLDKAMPLYEPGQPMDMRLTVSSDCVVERASVRITLRNDGDVAVGTSYSAEFTLEEGCNSVELSLPLNTVSKGAFYVSIGVYKDMDLGRRKSLDHITRAFRIEVPGVPAWITNAHGYVKLPEMSVRHQTLESS